MSKIEELYQGKKLKRPRKRSVVVCDGYKKLKNLKSYDQSSGVGACICIGIVCRNYVKYYRQCNSEKSEEKIVHTFKVNRQFKSIILISVTFLILSFGFPYLKCFIRKFETNSHSTSGESQTPETDIEIGIQGCTLLWYKSNNKSKLFWTFEHIFTFNPYPWIFGTITETTCSLWRYSLDRENKIICADGVSVGLFYNAYFK